MTVLSTVQVLVLAAVLSHADGQHGRLDRILPSKPPNVPDDVIHEGARLISMALRTANSGVILHDGSPEAMDVLQNFLTKPHNLSIQLGDMQGLLQATGGFPDFRRGLNEQYSVVLMVFTKADVVRQFLEAKTVMWITCPLLLLSLSPGEDARDILKEVNSVSQSSLLEAQLRQGQAVFCLLTYHPFAGPPKDVRLQTCGSGFVFSSDQLFPERFGNFESQTLQVASWIDDFPFLFYDSRGTPTGMCKLMLDEIAWRLNFTYQLQEVPPDGFWGDVINGTWMGMAGQIIYAEKDLLINGFGILLDRYHSMDLSVPYVLDSFKASLKIPLPPPRWLAVVYPFQGVVWACAVGTLLILTCAFHVIIQKEHSSVYDHKSDLISTALWLLRTVLRQSVARIPNTVGCRPVLYVWWLSALVLSTSYTGSLIAFLTVPSQASRITSLKGLAQAPNQVYLYDYGDFIIKFLKTSKDPVYRGLGEKMNLYKSYDPMPLEMERGHAFIEAAHYNNYLVIKWQMKDVYMIEEGICPYYYGWAYRKHTPWKNLFDKYITRILEAGLIDYWHRTLTEDYRRSQGLPSAQMPPEKDPLRPLSVEDIQGPFIAAAFGLGAATVVFLVEVLSFHAKRVGTN